jgi:hypothetical protein
MRKAVEQNARMAVGGMLGFDILHSLVMHIDYRDGLVKFDSPTSGPARTTVLSSITAGPTPSRARETTRTATGMRTNVDHPINSAIEGGVIGWLDSGHLKPGQSISVIVLRD